nr:hypothetical protein [Candidatus Njordarchaeota archaeon]
MERGWTVDSNILGSGRNHGILRGVFIARFDQVLGAIPFLMYPHGFITEEQARDAALEAMLLFMFGNEERTASIMGFEHLDFIGYSLLDFDPVLGNYVLLALFDPSAPKFLWQAYNTIKYFLVNVSKAVQERLSVEDALKKFCDEVNASWMNLQVPKAPPMEEDRAGKIKSQHESLAYSISLLIQSMIAEAVNQRLGDVKESLWNTIERVAETFVEVSDTYFGEEFTKTKILPNLLRAKEGI